MAAGFRLRLSDYSVISGAGKPRRQYRGYVNKDLIFGLRPEHITEMRGGEQKPGEEFTITLDVVEPMGMETMIYFRVNGVEVCGRVEPSSVTGVG